MVKVPIYFKKKLKKKKKMQTQAYLDTKFLSSCIKNNLNKAKWLIESNKQCNCQS